MDGISGTGLPIRPSGAGGASGAGGVAQNARLRRACEDFEAIFVNEMMKSMRATVPDGGLLPKKLSQEVFEGMFDAEISHQASGGLGVADLLYQEFCRALPDGAKGEGVPGRNEEGGKAFASPPEEVRR